MTAIDSSCFVGDMVSGATSADAAPHAVSASVSTTAIAASHTVESIALALAFGVAACALGEGLASAVGLTSINLAAMAVVASLFASVGTSINARAGASSASPFTGVSCLSKSSLQRRHAFYCPQMSVNLHFHCRINMPDLNICFGDLKKLMT